MTFVAVALSGACASPDATERGAAGARLSSGAALQSTHLAPGIGARIESGEYRPAWATRLLGQPTIDSTGTYLGKLTDLIVDMSAGHVRYALISQMQGPAERLVPVSVRLLTMTDKDALFLAMSRDRFEQQRSWTSANWRELRDSALWAHIDPASGAPLAQRPGTPAAYRLSRLIDADVDNLQGRHLGQIVDVVIDMNAQEVHYAILGFDRRVGAATEHAFAVPIGSLRLRSGSERLVLDVPHDRLARLIGSDPAAWKPLDGPRYIGTVDRSYELSPPHRPAAVGVTR